MSPDSLGLQDNDFPGLSLPQMSMHAECDCFLDSRVSERKFLHQQILKSGFADVALSQFTSTIVLARHDSSSLSEYLHVSGARRQYIYVYKYIVQLHYAVPTSMFCVLSGWSII
jgi:hypothetical protein